MKLYHGTTYSAAMDIITNGINLNCSQPMLDFGQGFYTTPDKVYAMKTAKNKTLKYNKKYYKNEMPAIIEFEYTTINDLNIKKFPSHNAAWMKFVLANRMDLRMIAEYHIVEHNLDSRYDVVCGEIADGNITQISYQIRNREKIPFEVDIKSLLTDNGIAYGYQFSFHTQKSLSCIKTKKCDIII